MFTAGVSLLPPVPDSADVPALHARIVGRAQSLFAADLARHRDEIAQAVAGSRVLVVGAAGSIGAAFVRQLVPFRPEALHLVDINENALVEVVRDLRASGAPVPDDFATFSVDFSGLEFARLAAALGPYDHFLNFSALKHVRAERDAYSLMRMIDVNVRALRDALVLLRGTPRLFSVSTDKSVRPANLMGATKNLMEQVLFSVEGAVATTARFANVAFSAGSLLEGFEHRLAKRQPLSCPEDVRRYFITHAEAGQLCLLAAFLGRHREAFFPRLPETALVSFAGIAQAFLAHHGLGLLPCATEAEARARVGERADAWPCHLTRSDTTGEKPFEEFLRPDDRPDFARFAAVGVVRERPPAPGAVDRFLAACGRLRDEPLWRKDSLADLLRRAVPDLVHEERGLNLDQKM